MDRIASSRVKVWVLFLLPRHDHEHQSYCTRRNSAVSSLNDLMSSFYRGSTADPESHNTTHNHPADPIPSETEPLLKPQDISTIPPYPSSSNTTTTTNPSPSTTMPLFFTLSTVFGSTAVMLGAFGAHGLKRRINDPARIANWSTASQYQLVHSVALLATALALPARSQRIPGALFVAGMTMFSGSLYLLVLDPQRYGKYLGPVTPIGGLCLIGGWIALGVVGRRFVRL